MAPFERYEWVRELGHGASGRVLCVRDRAEGFALRALKVVHEAAASQLAWEFAQLAQLDSPRVVRARELLLVTEPWPSPFDLRPGQRVLVEDLAEGVPLGQLLTELQAEGPARARVMLRVAHGLCLALADLHAAELVHGDVKPENVLCREGGRGVTLVDLGFAGAPSLVAPVSGTLDYLAPERLSGVRLPASDVYAMGALIFDALAGGDAAATAGGQRPMRERDVSRLAGLVPEAFCAWISACLVRDPGARPADGGVALEGLLPGLQLLGEAASTGEASPGWAAVPRSPGQRAAAARRLPFVGRTALLEELTLALATDAVVCVWGPRGSGRSRLIQESVRRFALAQVEQGREPPVLVRSVEALLQLSAQSAVLWQDAPESEQGVWRALEAWPMAAQRLVVVLEAPKPSTEREGMRQVEVGRLAADDFAQLAARLVAPASPRPTLLKALERASGRWVGPLCEAVAAVLAAGGEVGDARSYGELSGRAPHPRLTEGAERLATLMAWSGPSLTPQLAASAVGDAVSVARCFEELASAGLLDGAARPPRLVHGAARRLRTQSVERSAEITASLVGAAGFAPDGFWWVGQGDPKRALEAFEREADALLREGEMARAEAFLREACGYVQSPKLLARLAEALRAQAAYSAARAVLVDLPGAAAKLALAEACRLGGDLNEARRLLDALVREGGVPWSGRARAFLARVRLDAGDTAGARAELEHLPSAEDRLTGVRGLEVEVLLQLRAARPALASADRLVSEARVLGRGRELARAHSLRSQVALALGYAGLAAADAREALEHARSAGEAHESASFALNLGLLALDAGELGEALSALREATCRLSAVGRRADMLRAQFNVASLALLVGDGARAEALVEQAQARAVEMGDPHLRALLFGLRAELLVQRGSLSSARDALQAGLACLRDEVDGPRALLLARLAELSLLMNDSEAAASALRKARAALPAHESAVKLEVAAAGMRVALAGGRAAAARALWDAHADPPLHSAPLATRLRFMVAAVEVARALSDQAALSEAVSLCRSWLEAALHSLPPPLRASMRTAPEHARILSWGARSPSSSGSDASRWRDLVRGSRRLFAERGHRRVLTLCVELALELVLAERALVVERAADGSLRVLAQASLQVAGEPLSFSRSIVRAVISDEQPLATVDAGHDPAWAQARSVRHLNVRSVAALPLRGSRGGMVLYMDDRLRADAFGPDDLALLGDLVQLTQAALRAARELRVEARRADAAQARSDKLIEELSSARADPQSEGGFVGLDPKLLGVLEMARRVAPSDVPILVTGESGTGKEMLARLLHQRSGRAGATFVAESCAALPEPLLESALFGHVRGAFTGADRARRGLFELADRGTLFLDEVAEMSPALQAKLLRVVQEGEFRPVGGERVQRADVRLVVATRRDLRACVRTGAFREDLYYRLAVVTLELPALRERPSDIPLLVRHFLAKHGTDRVRLAKGVLEALARRSFPGNVRQLENEVRRALVLSEGTLTLSLFQEPEPRVEAPAPPSSAADSGLSLHAEIEQLTQQRAQEALARAQGNVTRAAKSLGLSRYGLQKILKRHERREK